MPPHLLTVPNNDNTHKRRGLPAHALDATAADTAASLLPSTSSTEQLQTLLLPHPVADSFNHSVIYHTCASWQPKSTKKRKIQARQLARHSVKRGAVQRRRSSGVNRSGLRAECGSSHGHCSLRRCLEHQGEDDEQCSHDDLRHQEQPHDERQAVIAGNALRHGCCLLLPRLVQGTR